jgi:hypothetical protein
MNDMKGFNDPFRVTVIFFNCPLEITNDFAPLNHTKRPDHNGWRSQTNEANSLPQKTRAFESSGSN